MKNKIIKFAVAVIVAGVTIFLGYTPSADLVSKLLCDYAQVCADK